MSKAAILAAISPGAGIGGVAIGGWIAVRGQRSERRHQRVRQQVDEFYGPIVGMRATILAKSELREHVSGLASEEWPKLFEGVTDADTKKEISDKRDAEFTKLIKYNNTQLRTELIPHYKKMRDHFSAHMSLAEQSTRDHFPELVKFIEVWDRSLD